MPYQILFMSLIGLGCTDDTGEECQTPPCGTHTTSTSTTLTSTTATTTATSTTTVTETAETAATTTSVSTNWTEVLFVNEFMAQNASTIADDNGLYSDWIEIYNMSEEAIDLDGFWITDNLEEPELHQLNGLTVEPGGFLILWADGKGKTGPEYLPFGLDDNGEELGLFSPEGNPIDQLIFGSQSDNLAAARMPDGSSTWQYVYGGTPGWSNVPLVLVETTMIEKGSVWAYRDNDQSEVKGWSSNGFDDSGWPTGAGPLGYGDDFIVTEIGYGGDSNNKAVTSYYRSTFEMKDSANVVSAAVQLMCDDGAIVYLNGVEIVRSNIPKGAVNEETLAGASTPTENTYSGWEFDTSLLIDGVNTIAAEVHQQALTSSDTSFDLSLTVDTVKPEE